MKRLRLHHNSNTNLCIYKINLKVVHGTNTPTLHVINNSRRLSFLPTRWFLSLLREEEENVNLGNVLIMGMTSLASSLFPILPYTQKMSMIDTSITRMTSDLCFKILNPKVCTIFLEIILLVTVISLFEDMSRIWKYKVTFLFHK